MYSGCISPLLINPLRAPFTGNQPQELIGSRAARSNEWICTQSSKPGGAQTHSGNAEAIVLCSSMWRFRVLIFCSPITLCNYIYLIPVTFCMRNGATLTSQKDFSQINIYSHLFLMLSFKLKNPSFSNCTSSMKLCHLCCREKKSVRISNEGSWCIWFLLFF